MACYHRPWAAHTVERRRAWHAIIALGRQTRSNDVKRDMPSPPLDSTHGRTMSGVACHHRLWTPHTVKRRRAWHASIAFGQHTIERRPAWHDITSFGQPTRSNDVKRDMPSPPLESTHGRTTSGVACRHHLWAAQTVERRRTWYDMIALGLHARSNNVGRGMRSSPLGSTNSRTGKQG